MLKIICGTMDTLHNPDGYVRLFADAFVVTVVGGDELHGWDDVKASWK